MAVWSKERERVASFALSCCLPPSPPAPLMSIQIQSCSLGLMPWIVLLLPLGGPHPIPGHHPMLNLKHARGRGALEPGCEAVMISQSNFGVSVTFRVTPTWVKCMLWRTSSVADGDGLGSSQGKFFICLIQTGWMLQR